MRINIVTEEDRQEMEEHFAYRLETRYGLKGEPKSLQKIFKKQAVYRNEVSALSPNKSVYIGVFKGKKVKFIYNHQIHIVKTALTLRG